MDIRFTVWAGYQLAPCEGTIEEGPPSVGVCDPNISTLELGTKYVRGKELKVILAAEDLKPTMTAKDI